MPKGYCRDQSREAVIALRDLIYGTGPNQRICSNLSRVTGISTSTLYANRREPQTMSLINAIRLLQAVGVEPEEIAAAIAGKKK